MSDCSRFTKTMLVFSLVCVSQIIVGCGGSGPSGEVGGTITLDGQPLPNGCQVLFMAEKGGTTATGVVGDGGHYTLVSAGGKSIPVGEYKVQVAPPAAAASDGAGQAADPMKMAAQMKLKASQKPEDAGPVPSKYGSTATSGLRFTVEAKQNTADFKLEKK